MKRLIELLWAIPLLFLAKILPPRVFNKVVYVLPKRLIMPTVDKVVSVLIDEDPTTLWNQLEVGLEAVGYNKKKGSKYVNAAEEVEAALREAPAMAPYRPYLLRWCERHRREVGLPV